MINLKCILIIILFIRKKLINNCLMVKDVLILVLWISKDLKMNLDEKEQIVNEPEDKSTQWYNKNK